MAVNKIITKAQVAHIARLAKLDLSEEELSIFTKQLGDVLKYMNVLSKVDTKGVDPTYQILDGTENIYREDVLENSFSQKEAISQANKPYRGYFAVKSVFGKGSPLLKKNKIEKRKAIDKYNSVLTEVNERGSVGHKDLFMTKDIETTAGSNVLSGYRAHYSSTIVKLLDENGFKTKYKLNQDAWGHGSSGENSDFGPTKNPWDMSRVAGGSSSGSAAAVSSGMVDFATGTDTGGSIRMPANFCNLTSIKPTYGLLSRFGVIAFASSLDCPSLISRDVKKLKKIFKIVSKSDKKDALSQSELRKDKRSEKATKIGIPREFFESGVDKEIKKMVLNAARKLEIKGAKLIDVSLPYSKYGVALYYIIAPTETSSNLARYDGVRYGNDRTKFGDEAKRRIMLGTYASSAGYADKYFEKASRVRTLVINDFYEAFKKVDALLSPVSPVPPFKIGEKVDDPLKMYMMDVYTVLPNLAGIPSLALPCGFTKSGLPIGMQIMGPRWSEEMLFELGEEYQGYTDWHKRRPVNRY